jgi:hypothetical protein
LACLSPADTITGNCYYFLNFSAVKHRQNNNRLINLGILGRKPRRKKNYQPRAELLMPLLDESHFTLCGGDSNAIDIFTSERERSEALSAGGSCHKSFERVTV